jgi:hypothetical protein
MDLEPAQFAPHLAGSVDESASSCFMRRAFIPTRHDSRRISSALPMAPPPSELAKAHWASRYRSYALLDALSFSFARLTYFASSSHLERAAMACASACFNAVLLS